jgi:hypothetical protein
MGKQYVEPFRQLVHDLGSAGLVAFVDPDGVDKRYQEHIVATLEGLGVAIASEAAEANFSVGGYTTRAADEAVGLAIETERLGMVHLFADGAAAVVRA